MKEGGKGGREYVSERRTVQELHLQSLPEQPLQQEQESQPPILIDLGWWGWLFGVE